MKINFATRQLIRSSSRGYLSTHFEPDLFKKKINSQKPFPYSTFTLTAYDYDACPIVLLSNLSEHTANIKNNNLVSIMLCEEQKLYDFFPRFYSKEFSYEDPMSRPRVTLIGNLNKTKSEIHKKRFLSRHPAAKLYAGFADMNFFKLDILGAHLIGGFASVKWFSNKDLINYDYSNFNESEQEILSHMNDCHQESVNLYVTKLIMKKKSIKKKQWKLVGIDPDGFDLRNKDELIRYYFSKEVSDAKKLRGTFVRLHKKALEI